MHLLECGRVRLQRECHVARDVGNEDDPYRIVKIDAELPAPREDYAECNDRAGDGERQHAEELENPLPAHLHLDDDIGDHDPGEHGDDGRREAKRHAVEDGVPGDSVVKEDEFE